MRSVRTSATAARGLRMKRRRMSQRRRRARRRTEDDVPEEVGLGKGGRWVGLGKGGR